MDAAVIRIKREELARLRELRGMRSWSDLARKMGVYPDALLKTLALGDAGGVRLGTIEKICEALSTDDDPVNLWDVVEKVRKEDQQ